VSDHTSPLKVLKMDAQTIDQSKFTSPVKKLVSQLSSGKKLKQFVLTTSEGRTKIRNRRKTNKQTTSGATDMNMSAKKIVSRKKRTTIDV